MKVTLQGVIRRRRHKLSLRFGDRRVSGIGGCRRYGVLKAHHTCTGAGVELSTPLPRALEVWYTPQNHQPEEPAFVRNFQPVAARSCRPVVNVPSGQTARRS
jgi:hypothetical protein